MSYTPNFLRSINNKQIGGGYRGKSSAIPAHKYLPPTFLEGEMAITN